MGRKDSIFLIILENQDYRDVLARSFFQAFANQGTLLTNSHGVVHPSQPNYFALTAGDTFVATDATVTLPVTNLVDLLEKKCVSWKVYAEGFPGACSLITQTNCVPPPLAPGSACSYPMEYVRKHNPFISYLDVQTNPQRCSKIVEATQLQRDVAKGEVPEFAMYIPNIINDAHNTSICYANRYMFYTFASLLRNPDFTRNRIFIITFDESLNPLDPMNHIYTALWGPSVKKNHLIDQYVNHYNILRTIEDHFHLGTLGRNDTTSAPIRGFLKRKKDRKQCAKIFHLPPPETPPSPCNGGGYG